MTRITPQQAVIVKETVIHIDKKDDEWFAYVYQDGSIFRWSTGNSKAEAVGNVLLSMYDPLFSLGRD